MANPKHSKKSKGVDGAEEPDVLAERVGSERITLEPLARCMFEGVFPRGPVVDYDFLISIDTEQKTSC